MFIDWLKSLRGSIRHSRRRIGGNLSSPVALEPRTLMSAVPVGPEFRVNTTTTGLQFNSESAVAMDSNGNFVITWSSINQDGSGDGIFAQRYDSAGNPVDSEFQVNTFTTGDQSFPVVAMDADGNFVIAWSSFDQDGSLSGIYAQRFNPAGIPQGSEFRANTYTTGTQTAPSIGMNSDGDFVIVWSSNDQDGNQRGVFAQRFSASGTPQNSEFQVNSYTSNAQVYPDVAMDSDGDFVVTWASYLQDSSDFGVYGQRFNSAGIPQGIEFRINNTTSDAQWLHSVAMDADGDFVVAWSSREQDGSGYGLYAQRFAANGIAQGPEFQVNAYTSDWQSFPSIGMDADGDFVVSWSSYGQDGDAHGIYARQFSSSGNPFGNEFLVNSFTSNQQIQPAIAMNSDGDLVIAWNSLGQDGSDYGIYAQRYNKLPSVNSWITGDQQVPEIALDADGDFVITWQSNGQDGSDDGIYAQRFNAQGNPQGLEFPVNSWTTGNQRFPSIAMDANGDFVISWTSYGQDGSGAGVYAQRYNAAGVPQGPEFQVNSWASDHQYGSKIAMNGTGDFVITWQSNLQDGDASGIFAQRYNSLGIPQGGEFQVNVYTSTNQTNPSVAMDDNGDFVISWESFGFDNGFGIIARRFDSLGIPLSGDFLVNTFTDGWQINSSVAMDAGGNFAITWQTGDQQHGGIAARRFNSSGTPLGSEFLVNTYWTETQITPSIAMDDTGDFVITWQSYGQDGSNYGIHAQRYNSLGVAEESEFQVNLWTMDDQTLPSVAIDADGDFVITWQSVGQDENGIGIYDRRFRFNFNAPTLNNAGNPTLDPLIQNQSLASNNGTLISDIIASMAPSGGITDPDSDPLGIAINGISNTYGSWEYTVNNGTNWTPIAVTGNTNALLLAADANTRVRFLPNTNFIGNTRFAFVAWDRTTGANGGTANVASRGGTTPYSLAYEYASINVVNVAPVLDPAGSPTLDTIVSNLYNADNPGTLVADIIARMAPSGGITDANPGALQGIAINGLLNTDKGSWQFTTNSGASWISIGTTGNSDARLLAADANTRIRFVPIAGFAGTASFAFVAWDRTSGFNGGITSVGTRGGSTPYSLAYDYASISVVNAAPVLNDAGNPLFDGLLPDTPDASNPGTLVSTLIARMYPAGGITDANPGALRGIAIIGKTATANGTWEYSTNNGTTWLTINATGGANALLLASDANTRVRYRPNPGFRGEAKIAFTAWDQMTGSNGATANASTRGGTTAFSLAYEYASLFVNTAPTLDASGTPTLDPIPNTITDPANVGTSVNTILNRMAPGGITDPDPGALRGMAIVGLTGTANGTWQYTTNNGTSWSNILTTGSANALLLSNNSNTKIRFVPNSGFTGTASIAFVAWDQTQYPNGSTFNAGLRGGPTPFSLLYDYASITIT